MINIQYDVGDIVIARFTNNNRYIEYIGIVTKVNTNTYRVASTKDGVNGWPAGHEFVIQSEHSPLQTVNNMIAGKFKK